MPQTGGNDAATAGMRFSRGLRLRSGGSGDENGVAVLAGQRRSAPAFSDLPQWLSWRYLWRDVGVRSGQLNAQPVERLSARKLVCSRPTKPYGWRMG